MRSLTKMIKDPRSEKKPSHLGDFLDFERDGRKTIVYCENGLCEVTVFADDLIRIRISDEDLEEDFSYAIVKPLEEFEEPELDVEGSDDKLSISTSRIRLEIDKSPVRLRFHGDNGEPFLQDVEGYSFSRDEDRIRTFKKIRSDEHFYGFGEKTGPLDKRGESMEMWARDRFYRWGADPLYVSIPFFIGVSKGRAYGIFFDNTYRTYFDMGKSSDDWYSFGADGGELDYYVFYGPEISDILDRYTQLTGRMEMPPKWALGYQQSRHSYKSEEEVLEIAQEFREREIPCDAIYLDIDHMDGYRVFTFDKERFPDPEGLVKEMRDRGFHLVPIVDPGIKREEEFDLYRECVENEYYCKNSMGSQAVAWSWPGLSIFPDFTRQDVREWWGDIQKFYLDKGIEGIWNDMNEPSLLPHPFTFFPLRRIVTRNFHMDDGGRNSNIERVRNVYALNENEGTKLGFEKHLPEKRPFILSRSGYAGIQRYAAIWTGDNWSRFDQVGLSARMLMNLGLSGVAFVGADIGGFGGIAKLFFKNRDLYARWIQTGVFYPFCRTHTVKFTRDQEPWSFGPEVEVISKRYIELRYQLLPYLYTLFWEASNFGHPIFRPMFFNYQEDESCYDERFEDQFMLGEDLLVVPISESDPEYTEFYLPKEAYWTNFWSENRLEGGKVHRVEATLTDIPIFVKAGTVLPMQPAVQSTKESVDTLIVHAYPGEGSFRLYEDDGKTKDYMEDKFSTIDFDLHQTESEVGLKIDREERGGFKLPYKKYNFEFHTGQDVETVIVDDEEVNWVYDELSRSIKFKRDTIDVREIELQL